MADQENKGNKLVTKFKKAGNRFLFELAIEEFYPMIIKEFKNWLRPLTPEKVKEMIKKGELPELDPQWFQTLGDYREYVLKIKIGRVAQAIGDARPDLGKAIIECGDEGGIWLHKLYVHLLECVDHPEKLIPEAAKPVPGEEMVQAHCQSCDKTWPVKKADFAKVDKCPFCGAGAGAPAPPQTEKPEEVPAQEDSEETQV